MKKILLILISLFMCAGLFAGGRKDAVKVNELKSYTSMEMDMVSYGNTVYEAVLAMNHTDLGKGTPIYINKFVNNKYDSTFQIDVEGFKNYEFDEHYSHYDFLKLYAIGPNEIILTVYSAFSDNRFAFIRIKDGKITAYKSYSLKNQRAYESQRYAFNGKDRIYVAFNGQTDFKETGWDLYLMSFDLDGNLKNAVSVYTKKNDELLGLAAAGDKVYFGIGLNYEKKAVLQLSKDLEYEKCLGCKYSGSDIMYINLESFTQTNVEGANGPDADGTLLVKCSMENQGNGHNISYALRFSGDGKFVCSYMTDESYSDDSFNFCKPMVSDEGILYFGHRTRYEPDSFKHAEVNCISYFMDWDGNKLYEKMYGNCKDYDFKQFANIDDKYFCSGENFYEADGIGHVAYTYLIDGETQDSNHVEMKKTDFNPIACPTDPDAADAYDSEFKYWEKNVRVEPIEIPKWDFGCRLKKIRLNFMHLDPLSKEITDSLPLFPFSER